MGHRKSRQHEESTKPQVIVPVGPTATAALKGGHPDLALLDKIQLGVAVCVFDVSDEEWWTRAADRVRELPKPRWLVTTADARYRAMLGRLARTLDACVIAARPRDLLRAALLPLAGLVRPGVIGSDVNLLEEACRAPSIGVASFDLDERHPADSLLVVLRDSRLSLHEINELFIRMADRYPEADIVATAPLFESPVEQELMATGYLAIERLHPATGSNE